MSSASAVRRRRSALRHAANLQPVLHVLRRRHVREQRVFLEDGVDVAAACRQRSDVGAAELDRPGGGLARIRRSCAAPSSCPNPMGRGSRTVRRPRQRGLRPRRRRRSPKSFRTPISSICGSSTAAVIFASKCELTVPEGMAHGTQIAAKKLRMSLMSSDGVSIAVKCPPAPVQPRQSTRMRRVVVEVGQQAIPGNRVSGNDLDCGEEFGTASGRASRIRRPLRRKLLEVSDGTPGARVRRATGRATASGPCRLSARAGKVIQM